MKESLKRPPKQTGHGAGTNATLLPRVLSVVRLQTH